MPICIETAMCNNLIAIAKVNLMKIKKDSLPPEMISIELSAGLTWDILCTIKKAIHYECLK